MLRVVGRGVDLSSIGVPLLRVVGRGVDLSSIGVPVNSRVVGRIGLNSFA